VILSISCFTSSILLSTLAFNCSLTIFLIMYLENKYWFQVQLNKEDFPLLHLQFESWCWKDNMVFE
jgi:hypothetical protein